MREEPTQKKNRLACVRVVAHSCFKKQVGGKSRFETVSDVTMPAYAVGDGFDGLKCAVWLACPLSVFQRESGRDECLDERRWGDGESARARARGDGGSFHNTTRSLPRVRETRRKLERLRYSRESFKERTTRIESHRWIADASRPFSWPWRALRRARRSQSRSSSAFLTSRDR